MFIGYLVSLCLFLYISGYIWWIEKSLIAIVRVLIKSNKDLFLTYTTWIGLVQRKEDEVSAVFYIITSEPEGQKPSLMMWYYHFNTFIVYLKKGREQ